MLSTYHWCRALYLSSDFLLHFPQLRQHHQKHCDHTGSAADDIGDGLRYKHAVGSEVEDARKEEREWHDHHHFAEEGEKDGLFLLAQCFKSGLPGVLEGLKHKGEEVKMERRDRIFH